MKALFGKLKNAFSQWSADKAPMLGAALAYYSVFSIGPLLLVIISLLGLLLGKQAATGQIFNQLNGIIGHDGAATLQTMIAHSQDHKSGIFSFIIGLVLLALGASSVFGQMQESFNQIWHIKPQSTGILGTIKDKFLSFGLVVTLAFLIGISVGVSAVTAALTGSLPLFSAVPRIVLETINLVISALLLWGLFILLYKVLSKLPLRWRDTFSGAFLAAVLFAIGKTIIGIYIGNSELSSTYGPSSSIVAILLWVYYTSQILFLGLEYVKVSRPDYNKKKVAEVIVTDKDVEVKKLPQKVSQSAKIGTVVTSFLVGVIIDAFVGEKNNKKKGKK